jgi:hypothetical protein
LQEGIGFARGVKGRCERFEALLAIEMSKVMRRDFLMADTGDITPCIFFDVYRNFREIPSL